MDDNDDNSKYNKTLIAKEKNDILQLLRNPPKIIRQLHTKLKKYRYIDNLNHLDLGRYIRWINISISPSKLYNGAFLSNIIEDDDDNIYLLLINSYKQLLKIKMEECIVFQLLTDDELLIINSLHRKNS